MDKSFIKQQIPDKQFEFKSTTSILWKEDVFDFFKNHNINNSLEIGTNMGWTAFFLSFFSKKVYTIDHNFEFTQKAKKHCEKRTNIEFIVGDAYSDITYQNFPQYFDLVVIDCIHQYDQVILDINRALNFMDPDKGIYILFDDYSHPESTGVRKAVDHAMNNGLKLEKYIGQNKGYVVNRIDGTQFTLNGPEGLILSYGK